MARERGFTLVEVLVAFAIAALLLVPLLRIFSSGMTELGRGEQSATATLWARTMLESAAGDALVVGRTEGALPGGYAWQRTIALYSDAGMSGGARPVVPYRISVAILWRERNRDRSLRLDTLRLGPPPPQAPP